MASADFCRIMIRHSHVPRFRLTQITTDKYADLPTIYQPNLPPCTPGSGRVLICKLTRASWPCMQYLFVRSGLFSRPFPDSDSRQTPLPRASTPRCQTYSSPMGLRLCRTKNKGRPVFTEQPCPRHNTTLLSSL
jgi:hypothetical protein